MFGIASKVHRREREKMTEEILELQKEKGEIGIAKDTLNLELANARKEHDMAVEKEKHIAELEKTKLQSEVARKEKHWIEDKARMEKQFEEDKKETIRKLETDQDTEMFKLKSMAKLESEQQIAQAKLDAKKEVQELEVKHTKAIAILETTHAKEFAAAQSKMEADYFEKMKKALNEINMEGNSQTKFSQEIVKHLINSTRPGFTGINVDVGSQKALPKMAGEVQDING